MISEGIAKGYDYKLDDNRIVWFKADQMAVKLGLVEMKYRKNGGFSIRWNSLNNYVKSIGATSCAKNIGTTSCANSATIDCGNKGSVTIPFPVKKGDYIPYPLVLRIAMRLNNDTAREFQIELINIVDSINENGIYTGNGIIDIGTDVIKENPSAGSARNIINNDIHKYAKFAGISIGQAYNKFYDTINTLYGINIEARKNNYVKKNDIKNYNNIKYLEDNNMLQNCGMAIECMYYNENNLRHLNVPSPIERIQQQAPITVINNINQQPVDDGYYHPNLKIVAEVTRTHDGIKTTCQTFEDDMGRKYFNTKKEQI